MTRKMCICLGFFSSPPPPVMPFMTQLSQVLWSLIEFMHHNLSSPRALSRFSTWLQFSRTMWEVCAFHTSLCLSYRPVSFIHLPLLSHLEVGQRFPKLLRREKWEWTEWQVTQWQHLHFSWKPDKNRCLDILNDKLKWKETFLGFRSKGKPDVLVLFSLLLQTRIVLPISCFLHHGLKLFLLIFNCTESWNRGSSQQTFPQNVGNSLYKQMFSKNICELIFLIFRPVFFLQIRTAKFSPCLNYHWTI